MESVDDHLDEQVGCYILIGCDNFRGEYSRPYGFKKEDLIEFIEDTLYTLKDN